MKSNSFGKYFGITAFGESHGPAIGVVIEDVRSGIRFPLEEIQKALNERKPGKNKFSSTRQEDDKLQVLSGVFEGKTTGMPICLVIYNNDARSKDYTHLKDIFRPSHADFSYFNKFKIYDYRGSGRASGRETISRVAASGLANDILGNVEISAYPVQIGKFSITKFDENFTNNLHWKDSTNFTKLTEYLAKIQQSGNSVGGIVEVKIKNLPIGLGDPVFEKLDANLAKAILSIGSVKGIEFGDGFQLAKMTGSEANDQMDKTGFRSNHSGGILGGISNGNEIIFRFVVKPTPSINISQKTVTKSGEETIFKAKGRHDTCIVLRILPVAKAMVKLVLVDAICHQKLISGENFNIVDYREALDKIDEDILIALARRKKISEKVKEFKQKNKIDIEDKNRENELISTLKEKANLWKINTEFIKNIWQLILENSKK
ncbi:MAG: chorismate synthase [Candidatus Cloacimonetes bacterium]|jgi:chorismate synthase|nr:chorismate synthase [Candidatus Cloacimonadota bacterium]MBT6994807.1 chorismate synthase [Candidatus Cloacimonadota bacterium]MBT7469042.1 chorismate synthase [Candidatus Cloacimonadota bacterium]